MEEFRPASVPNLAEIGPESVGVLGDADWRAGPRREGGSYAASVHGGAVEARLLDSWAAVEAGGWRAVASEHGLRAAAPNAFLPADLSLRPAAGAEAALARPAPRGGAESEMF